MPCGNTVSDFKRKMPTRSGIRTSLTILKCPKGINIQILEGEEVILVFISFALTLSIRYTLNEIVGMMNGRRKYSYIEFGRYRISIQTLSPATFNYDTPQERRVREVIETGI